MACNNPVSVNNTVSLSTDILGFSTVFNPYEKTVTFDISTLSTFGDVFGMVLAFKVTDPIGNVIGDLDDSSDEVINIGAGGTTLTIDLLTGGALFYGTYTINYRLFFNLVFYVDYSLEINVCYDSRLENANYIKGCITVDTNCSSAIMVIKEQTNFKYNGMTPIASGKTYAGTITYPDNYLAQREFAQLPYQISLNGSITGFYQVAVTTTARYALDDCHSYIDVTFKNKWADDVNCAGTLATLMCCWTKSLDIVNKGGTYGAQMEEKMQDASPVFNMALLAEFNGKNSEPFVKELQKLLGCDCKCQKGLQIQANPILIGNRNVSQACGTTVTTDENGDVIISSLIVTFGDCAEEYGFSFTKSADGCTQTWCLTIDYNIVQQQVLDAIASSSDYVNNWKDILGINSCPCSTKVHLISQTGASPTSGSPLSFSQVTICNGDIVTFAAVTVTSISAIVTALNANTSLTNLYGTFSLSANGTGIVSSYVPTNGSCQVIIYLYQNCDNTIIVNGVPLIIAANRVSTYYQVLNGTYFTKSDKIISFYLQDQTTITGGLISEIQMTETTLPDVATITAINDGYDLLGLNQCARELVVKTGTLTFDNTSTNGCKTTTVKNTSYARVDKSERWSAPYRANPQMNDLPYYGDYIYRNDVIYTNRYGIDGAGCIRIYNTKTGEVQQIAGNLNVTGHPAVANAVYGNAVEYYYPSSVYADKNDIVNGHATLYFAAWGGVLCKLQRVRTTECDERANWMNYIIAGADDGTLGSLPTTGNLARFVTPYGAKRFGTINSVPSFIIHNNGQSRIDFIYYGGSGSVNTSSNWNVVAFPIAANYQINVDRETFISGDVTYTNALVLYVFGAGIIRKYQYKGSETSSSQLVDATKYVTTTIINQALGSVDGDTSTVGRVYNPATLSKIIYNGYTTYVFSEEYLGAIPSNKQVLRGFYSPSDGVYTLVTLVTANGGGFSTFGNDVTGNGCTFGLFYHPIKARYYEFPSIGGIRKLAINNGTEAIVSGHSSGNYILLAEESGADSNSATAQDIITGIVDTNYELIIT